MEVPGGDMGDMKDRLSDAEVEALLTRSDEADPTLSELMSEIRDFAEWVPDSDTKSSHIVAAVTAAGAVPEGAVGSSLSQPNTRRPWMFRKIVSSRLARVLAAVLAVIMATGGMAYAGVLPHPIQSTVSDIVGVVGIDIDDGSANDLDDAEVDQVDDDQVDDVDDKAVIGVGNTDDDDQGQVDDEDQGTVSDDDQGQVDDDDQDVDDDDHGQISDDDHGKVSDDEDDTAEDGDHGTVSDDDEGHGSGHDDSAADDGGEGDD